MSWFSSGLKKALPTIVTSIATLLTIILVPRILPSELRDRLVEIKISATDAALRFEKGDAKGAVLFVPAQGGSAGTPWFDTKFRVKKGDILQLTASGSVHTDIYKLVTDARADTYLGEPWSSPAGLMTTGPATPQCDPTRVAPAAPVAALVGAIQSDSMETPLPFYIGANSTIRAGHAGTLLLAVNDSWLRPEDQRRYAHIGRDADPGHLRRSGVSGMMTNARIDRLWTGQTPEEVDTLPDTQVATAAKKMIQDRLRHFERIVERKQFDVWYRDNIGGYIVAIESHPCRKDECTLEPPRTDVRCLSEGGAPGPK